MLLTQEKEVDIFVGSKIGSFKHVKYFTEKSRNSKKCIENLVDIKGLQKDEAITCMEWGNAEQTEILIGKQNQQIQVYDTMEGFTETYTADFGTGHVVGLGRLEGALAGAVSGGAVKVWRGQDDLMLPVGGTIDKMRVFGDRLVGTGGEENDLKVWDASTAQAVFAAKNLAHDWLQLRRPVWVTDLCFLSESQLAVCSRHGYVRLYDRRAQRRPVCNVEASMAAACLAPAPNERQVLVGFGRGQLHLVDLRLGRLDKGFKGAAGAVTTVGHAAPLVVSAGLDRHLRVHDYHSKELVYKQYLTSKVSCLLVQTARSTPLRRAPAAGLKGEPQPLETPDDLEEIFQGMETVVDNGKDEEAETIKHEAKRKKSEEPAEEDPIKRLLKKTEKQKRRMDKRKRERRAKSVFHNA